MTKITTGVRALNENVEVELIDALSKELRKELLEAGKLVARRAKQLVPPPGYPGDKPELKPLRDTIGAEYREGAKVKMVIVGPKWPAGAHGFVVEQGHKFPAGAKNGFVAGRPYLEPAARDTLAEQKRIVASALAKADKSVG